jgi:hypothetical protein
MLKVLDERTFKRTVTVAVPVDGGFEDQTVDATYRVIDTDEAAKHDIGTEAGTREFLKAIVVRLDDLEGDKGKALEFSPVLFDKLIGLPYLRTALYREYIASVTGAREGN